MFVGLSNQGLLFNLEVFAWLTMAVAAEIGVARILECATQGQLCPRAPLAWLRQTTLPSMVARAGPATFEWEGRMADACHSVHTNRETAGQFSAHVALFRMFRKHPRG